MIFFDECFSIVVSTEGGFSNSAADPGNWTGKSVGSGILKGTKWGISAAAYPMLDIQGLSVEECRQLYNRDYWVPIAGDHLPGPLALIMFDSAVNSGVGRAARWLQGALGVAQDGVIGPATLAALEAHGARGADLFAEVLARRIVFDASLPSFKIFGLGWARRLAALPFQALSIGA